MIHVKHFYHSDTFTLSYLVYDDQSKQAAIIDPVLDFDFASGTTSETFIDTQVSFIKDNNLSLEWILETHAHADHISGAHFLKQKAGGKIAIGAGITQVQQHFMPLFAMDKDYPMDGSQFDRLLEQGDRLELGSFHIDVLEVPGHTPDSVCYHIEGHAFVGDTLFMPDSGSARCDFPGGSAAALYQSIQKIYALGDDTQLYMCHDYQPQGRELRYLTTVAEQKASNIQINQIVSEQEYIEKREARDAQLSYPRYILPSLQFNLLAGQLPKPAANGIAYIRIPLNQL